MCVYDGVGGGGGGGGGGGVEERGGVGWRVEGWKRDYDEEGGVEDRR